MFPRRRSERGRWGFVVAVTAALLAATVLPSTSGATAGAAPLFSATDCREAGSFFFLELSELEPYVPEELEVGEYPAGSGHGEVLVLTTTCPEAKVGKRSGPLVFSEVGIFVTDVDDSSRLHYYSLWHATDNKQVRKRLARMGVNAPLVPDMSLTSITGNIDADAQVPWRKAPYDMQVLVAGASLGAGSSRPSSWWYETRKGFVRVTYDVQPVRERWGTALFQTAEGSELAELLGTTPRPAHLGITVDYPEMSPSVARVKL